MSQQLFEGMYRSSQWLTMVQSQQSFALSMSAMCSGEFADLILRETRKSTEQDHPKSPDELALRQRQTSALTSKVSAIAYADSMARIASGASPQILQASREYYAGELPKTESEFQQLQHATSAFTTNISRLCSAAWAPQI